MAVTSFCAPIVNELSTLTVFELLNSSPVTNSRSSPLGVMLPGWIDVCEPLLVEFPDWASNVTVPAAVNAEHWSDGYDSVPESVKLCDPLVVGLILYQRTFE